MEKTCSIDGCVKAVKSRGMCSAHAERYRIGLRGDRLTKPIRDRMKDGKPKEMSGNNGYIYISVDGKKKLKHRLVMEEHIGRSLKSSECVHHRDGNPLNNSISNLVITTQSEHMMHYHKKYKNRLCAISGCGKKLAQCGFCSGHCHRLTRLGDPFPEIPIGLHSSELKKRIPKILQHRKLGDWLSFLLKDAPYFIPKLDSQYYQLRHSLDRIC